MKFSSIAILSFLTSVKGLDTTVFTTKVCDSSDCSDVVTTAYLATETSFVDKVITSWIIDCSNEREEQETVTELSTTVISVENCGPLTCTMSPSTALISIATETVEGVVTRYTTWCPLTAEHRERPEEVQLTRTVEELSTVTVSVENCGSLTCTMSPSLALATTVTETVEGVETEYTTWRPLTEHEVEHTTEVPVEHVTEHEVEHTTEVPVEHVTEHEVEHTTEVPVEHVTEHEVEHTTEVPVEHVTSASQVSVEEIAHTTEVSSTHSISSYEGVGNKVLPGFGAVIIGAIGLLI